MAEHQLPLIAPETASKARAELLAALQVADHPSAWMDFMQAVTRLLPEILSSGRPSTDSINRSPIGQLGFRSWQAMIEAPADAGGLAWNFSAWKAWRRAWATVQTYPWLRSMPLTSSEVNTLANELKRLGKPFPGSPEALQQLLDEKAAAATQKRAETLTETQKALADALLEIERLKAAAAAQGRPDELVEAQAVLAEVRRQLETATAQLHLERAAGTDQQTEIGRLQGVIDGLRGEIEQLRTATPNAGSPRLSLLQRLRAFLFGS